MKVFCNPLNIPYRYQFNQDPRRTARGINTLQICREAADPSMILFQNRYYLFVSMNLGVYVSDDLVSWEYHRLPDELPLYDYAPDVRVMNGYVYLSASSREHNCDYYRTKDVLNGPYEKIEGTFPFWDPNMFIDDDGKVYFYWGCSNITPIYGTELDPVTLRPKTDPIALIEGHPTANGYERFGEENSLLPASEEEIDAKVEAFFKMQNVPQNMVPKDVLPLIRGMFADRPYVEGAWMDKYNGRYYLQYACPGTQFNVYSDGVYVSDDPLGPFTLAKNNPYSYRPGGFLPGAGHGSTMKDKEGRWWHTATMRISKNHDFERRVGLWRAGFDADGELYCDQRYGDWPMILPDEASRETTDPEAWQDPPFMLLSYHKKATATSSKDGCGPENTVDENVQTWWKAATNSREEALMLDLQAPLAVHAVQINFADDSLDLPSPGPIHPGSQARYIDEASHQTQWLLEGSLDGESWTVLQDKTNAATDLPHDFLFFEEGRKLRYLRLSHIALPFEQEPCVSGLRVFGFGLGHAPAVPAYTAKRLNDLDMLVTIPMSPASSDTTPAVGYNILFGDTPEKLYHSYMVFAKEGQDIQKRVGALIAGRSVYVRVDAFNENGITKGSVMKLEK